MKLTVPYYLHKAGAGFPSPATDYIEEDIDLNIHLIKNVPATFIIRVQGKSMVDVGINDGDAVIIKKSNTAENGRIVVALIDDNEAMLKIMRKKGNSIAPESANKRYETKIYGPDRVKVQGVLVSLYRNF